MALRFLPPKPGAKLQVIGAGMPRTGTNSFCAALSILLDGPTYHAGVQYATGTKDETHILTLIELAEQYPFPDQERKKKALNDFARLLDGYVAVADPPTSQLVPELMEMYPDAKVICTVRDKDTWITSMLQVVKTSQPALAGFLFFWIPSVRYLPRLARGLTNLWLQKYGVQVLDERRAEVAWDRHHAQLEAVVPKDKLFYVSVKDGWPPLCKALDLPVPDVPYPRLNDAKDLEKAFKKLAFQGLLRWAAFFLALAAVGFAAYLTIIN